MSDGDRLAAAVREVATGGSMLDPEIVAALVSPVRGDGDLSDQDEELLQEVAQGRPVKAIAAVATHHPRGRQRRHRVAVRAAGQGGVRPAARGRCGGCACCTAPSWIVRSRARP